MSIRITFGCSVDEYEWFLKQPWNPPPQCIHLEFTVIASKIERKYLEDNFENIPKANGKDEVIYRGEIAKFIVDNFNPLYRKL